ncbi:hypothetical protein KM043_002087 [Ampulex compressa]|nr:hypothetical protein KM043_002087 [Ampulex compressa]
MVIIPRIIRSVSTPSIAAQAPPRWYDRLRNIKDKTKQLSRGGTTTSRLVIRGNLSDNLTDGSTLPGKRIPSDRTSSKAPIRVAKCHEVRAILIPSGNSEDEEATLVFAFSSPSRMPRLVRRASGRVKTYTGPPRR